MPETKETGLAIYVGNDLTPLASGPGGITQAQLSLLTRKTPRKYIKKRKGRGGKELSYVEISYVQGVLNAVFGLDWDVKVVDKIINYENYSIAMCVELVVRFADGHVITKHAWGGSDIKRTQDGQGLVDFADDLKAAESDAIKKAASMLGVAWDVFSGQTDIPDSIQPPPERLSKFHLLDKMGEQKKLMGEDMYHQVLRAAGYNHANEIPPERRQAALDVLQAVHLKILKEKSDEKAA